MTKTYSTPTVFLLYQQRWAADRSPVKVMEKSRRIGLSWSEAADDSLYAAEASGDDVWYIGYNKEMAEEFRGNRGTALPMGNGTHRGR